MEIPKADDLAATLDAALFWAAALAPPLLFARQLGARRKLLTYATGVLLGTFALILNPLAITSALENFLRHLGELLVLPIVGLLLAGLAPQHASADRLSLRGVCSSAVNLVARITATLFAVAWLSTTTLAFNISALVPIPERMAWLIQPGPLLIAFLIAAMLTFARTGRPDRESHHPEAWVFQELKRQGEERRAQERRKREARRQAQPGLEHDIAATRKWTTLLALAWASVPAGLSVVPLRFAAPPIWSGLLLLLPLVAIGTAIGSRALMRRLRAAEEGPEEAVSAHATEDQDAASPHDVHEEDVHEDPEAAQPASGVAAAVVQPHWWEVLEVAPQTRMEELKRAYRRKVQLYHPDRVAGLAPELVEIAETRTRQLNLAFEQAKQTVGA